MKEMMKIFLLYRKGMILSALAAVLIQNVEQGTHTHLLKKKGFCHKLCTSQFAI